MVVSYGENPVVQFFTCFKPKIISVFSLPLRVCNYLTLIFIYFVCRKWLSFTKKNPLLFPICGVTWQWEVVRVSYGLFLMFWSPLDGLSLYDGYMWSLGVFFMVVVVYSDWEVFFSNGLFKCVGCWLFYELLWYYFCICSFNFVFVEVWFVTLYWVEK